MFAPATSVACREQAPPRVQRCASALLSRGSVAPSAHHECIRHPQSQASLAMECGSHSHAIGRGVIPGADASDRHLLSAALLSHIVPESPLCPWHPLGRHRSPGRPIRSLERLCPEHRTWQLTLQVRRFGQGFRVGSEPAMAWNWWLGSALFAIIAAVVHVSAGLSSPPKEKSCVLASIGRSRAVSLTVPRPSPAPPPRADAWVLRGRRCRTTPHVTIL